MLAAGACGGRLVKQYEYEEDLHLSLDGSAVVYVSASVPALVALRGAPLDLRPTAYLDRGKLRTLYTTPAARVTRVSTSRRLGRRFVHVRVEVDDVRTLSTSPLFAWSTYRFDRGGGQHVYQQVVGAAARREVGQIGWTGAETVAFRLHVPSRIDFHNAGARNLQRGNILVWERLLTSKLAGEVVDLQVRMQSSSILARTLMLFAASGLAAMSVLALVVWWVVRRGKGAIDSR